MLMVLANIDSDIKIENVFVVAGWAPLKKKTVFDGEDFSGYKK